MSLSVFCRCPNRHATVDSRYSPTNQNGDNADSRRRRPAWHVYDFKSIQRRQSRRDTAAGMRLMVTWSVRDTAGVPSSPRQRTSGMNLRHRRRHRLRHQQPMMMLAHARSCESMCERRLPNSVSFCCLNLCLSYLLTWDYLFLGQKGTSCIS